MNPGDDSSFENLECPNCKKVGGMSWDYASRSVRCSNCYASGMDLGAIMEKSSGGRRKSTRPREQVKPFTTNPGSSDPTSDDEFTADIYVNQEGRRVVVSYAVPKAGNSELLEANPAKCAFHRWRLHELIANEKRYGRDNLRKRGFIEVERHRHEGKIVRIFAKKIVDDDDE